MELLVVAVVLVVAGLALSAGLKMLFSGKQNPTKRVDSNTHEAQRTGRSSDRDEKTRWQELDIEWRHPGPDWVYLPKFDKDNECKLICISDMGHRDAVKPIIKNVVAHREYSLALKREPSNRYDRKAIQVIDTTR